MSKYYISTDAEGIGGNVNWDQEKDDTAWFRKLYVAQVKAVVHGICAADAGAEIVISDSHSRGVNLHIDDFDTYRNVSLVNGFPRYDYMMTGFDDSFEMIFAVGYHSGIGTPLGQMDHSYSASVIYNIEINGHYMNETTINAAYASELGVPFGLVVTDDVTATQLAEQIPGLPCVVTKQALGRYAARSFPLFQVHEAITAETTRVVQAGKVNLPLYRLDAPYLVHFDTVTTAQADRIAQLPWVQRVGGRGIEFTLDSMRDAMNAIVALVGLGATFN
jgi:D-amino peptidase